jgi:hypothetical protein
MNTPFIPHPGQIFAKQYNDGIKVLVITPIDRICDGGWFCLGLPIYRDGSFGRPMLVSIHSDDRLVTHVRLPKVAALALRRHRAIQRRNRAAYVADDSCEMREGNGNILYIRGGI